MYTLKIEYQILVTARIRSPLEWMVCCFRCSRILINLQMFSIILRSGDWDGQSRQSTSLLSFHNFVCTDWCTGALSSWKIHWLFSNFATTGQRLLSRMSMYLAEVIFPSTYVIVPTPSLQIHPKTLQTHGRRHCDFHTVLSIACSTFPRIFATHTHVNFSQASPAFHQKILFYSIVLVLFSVVYFGTIFFDFSTKLSVLSQQFFCESHFKLNRLWIDLLQIGTGTDWLNSFIKLHKLPLRSCFTSLINVRSPCLLVDLGRPVRSLFSMFSRWSNIFKNLDTADRLNPIIFPISVFLNPSWCSRTTCRFWSGLISFVFLAIFAAFTFCVLACKLRH